MIDFITTSSGVFVGQVAAFAVLYIISTIVSNIKANIMAKEFEKTLKKLDEEDARKHSTQH